MVLCSVPATGPALLTNLDLAEETPDLTLASLRSRCGPPSTFTADRPLSEVMALFEAAPDCPAALVVHDDQLLAVLSQQAVPRLLARGFGQELFEKRPLSNLLAIWDVPALQLPGSIVLSDAITTALNRPADYRFEPIVVLLSDRQRFLLDIHQLLLRQCEVLGSTLIALERQRQATFAAEREREQLHDRLVEASRQAGRAEVATGVLHNVGNVLNSMNVSASLVTEKLRQSKVSNLGRAVDLINQHQQDLGQFLSSDEKGRQLPSYLLKLAEFLEQEYASMHEEMNGINNSIEHIKQIVKMQQSYAKSAAVLENISPAQLFADAERVNLVSFERHNINVVRKFADLPAVELDKHRVLQILINLISNAKNAVKAAGRPDKQITLRLDTVDRDGRRLLRFEVSDNGIGIPAENLTRIFSHGFTTRKEGHGFGLHGAALAAREISGDLTATSDGPGQGATFTLTLPAKSEVLA